MFNYILRRLLMMIPTLFGITFIVVTIMLLAPGEPAMEDPGGRPSIGAEGGVKKRSKHIADALSDAGLTDEKGEKLFPPVAWWNWTTRKLVKLDFGESFRYHRPVLELLGERVPITLFLNFVSLILIYLISIPIGVWSSTHQHTARDGALATFLFMLYSMPSWWVATMLIVCFGSVTLFDWFPIVGIHSEGYERFTLIEYLTDSFMHLLLPIICLTYGGFAGVSRYMRTGMLEVIRQDYVRTARAKGLDEKRVIKRHAFRNALIPIVTLLAGLLPAMIGGSVIIEMIFSIKGMGLLSFEAILNRDYLVVMAVTLLAAMLTLVGILLSDIAYCLIDPRISLD